jgi:DNA-binding transcriptional regulator GbsR (MarR family)
MTAAGGGDASDGAHLVDDFGLHIGRAMGWPPMAGRAAGVLMLSEQSLTLTQLQEALAASKGSASEMTRLLMVNGVVERYKPPGSRQFVYRWRSDAWLGCLRHQLQQTTQLLELSRSAQDVGMHLPGEQRERLREMHDYYTFMAARLESLVGDYSRRLDESRATP